MRREKRFALVILVVFIFSFTNIIKVNSQEPIAYLVLKTNGGGIRPDYGLYIAQYLRDIGIEVEVKVEEWCVFIGTLLITTNYDIGITELDSKFLSSGTRLIPGYISGASPDFRDVYTEEGYLNIFGLGPDLPYGNISEIMQQEGVSITNLETRQQHYYDFQQLMMDKIVPLLPLFSSESYMVVWANTRGYNALWGLVNSFPYMSFDGLHEGQTNLTEFNLANANWRELCPLFIADSASSLVSDFISEPIIQFSLELAPTTLGLVENWTKIDDFHYKFVLRDNLFWNPSYNTTERNASSVPLSSIPTGELMLGLKNGEYSNGSNQQITAKDAVFTYLSWSNPIVSQNTLYHEWISNIYIDPVDDLAFHIHIDGNPDTPEPDEYVDLWTRLPTPILPEFFLNSTNSTITFTNGGVKCAGLYPEITVTNQWVAFSTSAFGCGKFMLDYSVLNTVTVLTKSPYWYGVGAIDGSTGMDIFVDRVRIRVIPDKSAELAEFKAGKLDWTDLAQFSAERKQMQSSPTFDVQSFVSSSMVFMFFNLRRPFIGGADNFVYLDSPGIENYTRAVGIRKAICYAIDREEMNQVLHDGEYSVCHSVIPPSNSYYYNDIIKYHKDLDVAFCWLNGVNPDVLRYDTEWYYYGLPIIFLPVIILISLPTKYWERMVRKLFRRGGKAK